MSSTLRRLPLLVAARPRNGSRQVAPTSWGRRTASSQLLSSLWPTTGRFSTKNSPPVCVLLLQAQVRYFNTTASWYSDGKYDERAKRLSQKSLDEHEQEVKVRKNQVKRPWHREGADKPPVDADGAENEPQSKGKLLTTPTRLLKLVLPLPLSAEKDKDNNGIEFGRSISPNDTIQPLALLVHPQQPLSYVERLIQAELPPVLEKGREKVPNVYFRAEDASKESSANEDRDSSSKSGTHVASYSGLGHEGPSRAHKDKDWVRWSNSTEIGDFIRDAARGREFAVEIEGFGSEIRVGVPSFKDRTHYLCVRLRKMSRQVDRLSRIKHECDMLAHRAAHRLAKGGLVALATWWGWVYYVTFLTDYGWDLVEPVTYLAGLATIMGGYWWFLYISRDLSYRSAMNITVSRRQTALYEARGFNVQKWDQLVQEANALRKEIKIIADEYDVEWDETRDLGGEDVKKVLEKEKKKRRTEDEEEEDDDDEEEEKEENKTEGKKGSEKDDGKA